MNSYVCSNSPVFNWNFKCCIIFVYYDFFIKFNFKNFNTINFRSYGWFIC